MISAEPFSVLSLSILGASGVLCFLIPIAAWLALKRIGHYPLKAFPAFVGAAVFIVFVLVLENLLHSFVLGNGSAISSNPMLYALYGSLAAGVFEEAGRFAAFQFLLKKHQGIEAAFSYGIGHGGIESWLFAGLSNISVFALALLSNYGMLPESLAYESALASVRGAEGLIALSFLERLFAFAIQMGLSVMVYLSVREPKRGYLLPFAILAHALVDYPAGLYQAGALNIYIVEAYVAVCGLAAFALTYSYARRTRLKQVERERKVLAELAEEGEEPL